MLLGELLVAALAVYLIYVGRRSMAYARGIPQCKARFGWGRIILGALVIQGFGNLGSNAARLMSRRGYKIIGVSKSTGGLYDGNGMDVNALWMYYKRNRSLEGVTGAEEADPAELLLRESDILIPAAAENQITSRNADRVKARVLCEGANGPTTANADDRLADKRAFVIPH